MSAGELEEAFKLKAHELLNTLAAKRPAADAFERVRVLFDQAKAVYKEGRLEDALVLVVQAVQQAKKA